MKKRKSMIRVASCLMALFLLAPVVGCGNNGTSGSEGSQGSEVESGSNEKEPVVLRMLSSKVDTQTSSLDDTVGQKIYEDTGIEIEFIPFSESLFEKARMMLAAQDFEGLDFVTTALNDITSQYISAGMLVNLDDHRDKLENFYAYEEDVIPYWRTLDKENGGLYFWQAGPDQIQLTSTCLDVVTRVDALEACGWPELDTTDDYIAFLKEAKEKIPQSNGQETIGMSCFLGDSVGPLITTYLPRHSGYQSYYESVGMIDVDSSSIIPLVSDPAAKEGFAFYNTLWREGLLDREVWTDGFNECQAKADSGVPICINFMNWATTSANIKAAERGEEEMQYIVTPIRLTSAKEEGKSRYEAYSSMRPDETTGILSTSQNIDKALELINYMATEEMTLLSGWGVEGEDYTVDADGQLVCTDEFVTKLTSGEGTSYIKERGIDEKYVYFPTRSNAVMKNGQAGKYINDPAYLMASATDTQLKAYNQYGWEDMTSPWRDNPNFEFVPFDVTNYVVAGDLGTESDIAKTEEKITSYLNQQIPIVITAETQEDFEAKYAEMCAKVQEMGIDDVIAAYNQQLDEVDALVEGYSQK